MTRRMLIAAVVLLLAAGQANAQSNASLPKSPVHNPANGHYYQYIINLLAPLPSFEDALGRAAATSHLGIPGHLVTITSQAEQDFLTNTFYRSDQFWLWIAASDAAVEGEWRWVAGPEAGQLFWLGNHLGAALGFQSWTYNRLDGKFYEPNNFPYPYDPRGEDYAAMQLFGPQQEQSPYGRNLWNDVASGVRNSHTPVGYIIEFSPVPEPGSMIFGVIALLAVSLCCRHKRRKGDRSICLNPDRSSSASRGDAT